MSKYLVMIDPPDTTELEIRTVEIDAANAFDAAEKACAGEVVEGTTITVSPTEQSMTFRVGIVPVYDNHPDNPVQ